MNPIPAIASVVLLVVATVAPTSAQSPARPDDPFARCSEPFARSPDNYDSAYCFYEVTFRRGLWDDGARVFETLIGQHPENLWLPLAYGHVYRTRDPDRAEALYRKAADGFQERRHIEGEILARSNLRNFLFPKGRVEDSAREMERVAELGRLTTDPLLKARAWTLEASHVQDAGGDLSHAYRLLKQTEGMIFPDGPYRLKRSTLNSLGVVAFRLGRLDEALGIFHRLDTLAEAEGEDLARANAQYNILNTSVVKEGLLPSTDAKAKLMQLAERSLATATAAQNRDMTLKTHRAIAELLMTDRAARAKALEHVEGCLGLAIKLRQALDEAVCSWVKAAILRESAPREALAAERNALAATDRAKSLRTQAYSARRRMRSSWDTKSRAEAIEDSKRALDAVETLRSLQDDSDGTAELFSTWTSDYYWFAGRLLQAPEPGDIERAFSIVERMRARSLLDTLERARAPLDPGHAAVKTRRALLEQIAAVQRKLMDPSIAADDRRLTLGHLQDLELRERDARRQIAAAFPSRQEGMPSFASLGEIQRTLAANEALLSFHVGLWETYAGEFGGGSWLVSLTRGQETLHRIPDRAQLAPMVPMFAGLLERADGLDAASAARLYDELLEQAISRLPPGIDRLIIVPDGPLHHLPFDALRKGRDGPALAAGYELVLAPSATIWRHWRTKTPTTSKRALAFADPLIDRSLAGNASERNAALQRGLRLGRLPYARREGDAIERYLGNADILTGARASEKALKERNLSGYGILHFAVHAIADEVHPERSAVLLSSGAKTEDGLLQTREIQELDLDGRIVVLSACQTASGAVLSGEGVMSLARAFFEGGAHAVIGTRWPIRDDDAASLFEVFYQRVGEGATLSGALKAAKADAIARRRPAATWSSLVLLGDGNLRPFPGGQPVAAAGRRPPAAVIVLLLSLLSVPLAVVVWRRTRRAPGPSAS